MRTHNPYVIRAIGVSHTACEDELRQNLRSQLAGVYLYFYNLLVYIPGTPPSHTLILQQQQQQQQQRQHSAACSVVVMYVCIHACMHVLLSLPLSICTIQQRTPVSGC